MTAYYNEVDKYCAQWLRNLIDAGHIAPGIVDERSIEDIVPNELKGFTQCHFFAGLGGWSLALRLAGWDDSRPCWTGSAPCQPFSAAGKGAGFDDERHLWPAWQHLIAQCRPAVIFGEQVASATEWLGLVRSDLEALDYAVGCMPIEASSAGASHGRDRFFFVADTDGIALSQESHQSTQGWQSASRRSDAGGCGKDAHTSSRIMVGADGVSRPCEPSTPAMAHALPENLGRLRAYGNAIVPQVAAAFIESYCEARGLIAMESAA